MFKFIKSAIARFRADERASQSIEVVIIFPILVWAYLGMFAYFDSFRAQSLADKAAFAITDLISRETDYITPAYMETLHQLHGMMTNSNHETQMRVTILRWNDNRNRFQKVWMQRKGGVSNLSNAKLRTSYYTDRLPEGLPHNERVILVETWTIYEPPFQVGLPAVRFDTFVVQRPRFADQVCWNPDNDGDASTARC